VFKDEISIYLQPKLQRREKAVKLLNFNAKCLFFRLKSRKKAMVEAFKELAFINLILTYRTLK